MDIYKLKFSILQQEILRFLFMNNGLSFNQRSLAKHLEVSPTAIAKSLPFLEKEALIKVKRDPESKTNTVSLNSDNVESIQLKRAENLKMFYESKIASFLYDEFPGATIVLFGSYSKGEDSVNSDIDLAIVGTNEKNINLDKFEKILQKKIVIQFYPSFREIHKNLRENIFNGILIKGGIEL